MKPFLTLLFATICAAAGYGQTIKTLGYNTTNGQVVYSGTNALAFTNSINAVSLNYNNKPVFSAEEDGIYSQNSGAGEWVATWETNVWRFYVPVTFNTTNISSATRTNLGIPWVGLTETNAANFQGALFAATNATPTNTNAPTPNAWLDVRVGTNTYKLPLWQ